jgi:hypothetical protein
MFFNNPPVGGYVCVFLRRVHLPAGGSYGMRRAPSKESPALSVAPSQGLRVGLVSCGVVGWTIRKPWRRVRGLGLVGGLRCRGEASQLSVGTPLGPRDRTASRGTAPH